LREAVGWLMDYRAYWSASYDRLDGLLDELKELDSRKGQA
jgi:hypothetical protein